MRFAIGLLLCFTGAVHGSEKLIDLSGVYVDNGMTVRASEGAPRIKVSLCALLTHPLDMAHHAVRAGADRHVKISQQGDLVMDIVISGGKNTWGGKQGRCVASLTKADGMKVDSSGITYAKRSRAETISLRFEKGSESSLVVEFEYIPHSTRIVGRKAAAQERGRYEFPRVSSGEVANQNR